VLEKRNRALQVTGFHTGVRQECSHVPGPGDRVQASVRNRPGSVHTLGDQPFWGTGLSISLRQVDAWIAACRTHHCGTVGRGRSAIRAHRSSRAGASRRRPRGVHDCARRGRPPDVRRDDGEAAHQRRLVSPTSVRRRRSRDAPRPTGQAGRRFIATLLDLRR
jgi:hypothetical protein